MAYASNDITSVRYLASNIIYQATQSLLAAKDETDSDILDDAVLMLDVVVVFLTQEDKEFAREWAGIQADRMNPHKAPYAHGEDRAQDQAFRWRELKALWACTCRKTRVVEHASPSTEWEVKA